MAEQKKNKENVGSDEYIYVHGVSDKLLGCDRDDEYHMSVSVPVPESKVGHSVPEEANVHGYDFHRIYDFLREDILAADPYDGFVTLRLKPDKMYQMNPGNYTDYEMSGAEIQDCFALSREAWIQEGNNPKVEANIHMDKPSFCYINGISQKLIKPSSKNEKLSVVRFPIDGEYYSLALFNDQISDNKYRKDYKDVKLESNTKYTLYKKDDTLTMIGSDIKSSFDKSREEYKAKMAGYNQNVESDIEAEVDNTKSQDGLEI